MVARFQTPQDAENAFYEAFEAAHLPSMATAWASDPDIVCIHPGSHILRGWEAIRESWKQIFANENRMSFTIHHRQWIEQSEIAIHTIEEEIAAAGANRPIAPPIPVTNIYRHTADGWRMILHHASPPPVSAEQLRTAGETPPKNTVH